uniref:Cyclin-dependent kinases regulatory subunit n=2 Tax=Cyprininae TaxID=2743694 RepID=A0A8C1FMA1_CYPCA
MAHKQIYYSDKYTDDLYEYRHVVLPRELAKQVPKSHLMSEDEWRRLGVQQSLGWVHYMIHEPGLTHSSVLYLTRLKLTEINISFTRVTWPRRQQQIVKVYNIQQKHKKHTTTIYQRIKHVIC